MADSIRVGTTVLYTLGEMDVKTIIERRRTIGASALYGNVPRAGEEYPALIVRDWGGSCNLVVTLDGYDTLWATSRVKQDEGGPAEGRWRHIA